MMLKSQQINLYLPPLRRDPPPLHPQMMLELCGIFILVLVLIGAFNIWRAESLTEQLTVMSRQADDIQTQLNAVSLQHPASNAAALDRQISDLQQSIKHHQAISDLIQTQNLGNAGGFSSQLTGLARQYESDITLTSFELVAGGQELRMTGFTRKADRVPRYLKKLRVESSFLDTRLGAVTIERETRTVPLWTFRVGPEPAKGDSP